MIGRSKYVELFTYSAQNIHSILLSIRLRRQGRAHGEPDVFIIAQLVQLQMQLMG
jgi:hypothetical protein